VAAKKKVKGAQKAGGGANGQPIVVGLLLLVCACAGWLMLKPSKVLVPSLVGKTEAEARALLETHGLSVMTSSKETDQAELDGRVLTQEPASGTAVPKMAVVTLTIGKGPDGTPLPDVVGKTRSEAEDVLLRLGFKVEFQETKANDVPVGRVISQNPPAGQKVARQATVTLVISGGAGQIEVPDLVNLTVEEARAALERIGLTLHVTEVAQDDYRTGDPIYVLRQEPAAGEKMPAGASVTIFIPVMPPVGGAASPSGAGASHAPRFEGLTVGAAKKLAAEQGVILEFADSADETRVITFQDPPPGDPLSGQDASVVVRVAESAVVPSLSGLSEAQARAQLEKAGLSVGRIKKSHGEIPGEVLDQRPSPGIEAVAGSSVDLVISDPQAAAAAAGPAPTPDFTPAPWVE
jgi:beta-lactam-binding protein with PASTA domain